MTRTVSLDIYATLVCMVGVLLLGRFVIRHVKFLKDYDIPEPVVGGVIVAFAIMIAHHFYNFKLVLDSSLKEPLMLTFFITIGLSADFASLKKGGKMLGVFLIAVGAFVILQDLVGVGVASLIGVNPLMGLLGGSISLTGGHGTSAAWSSTFSQAPYNFSQSLEVSIVCATFGLVSGGIIGGPVAHYLIKKYHLEPSHQEKEQREHGPMLVFETPKQERLITANSFIESLALVSIALLVGTFIANHARSVHLGSFALPTLPTFVWCLFVGVLLRNVLTYARIHRVFDREVGVIGNVSLSLFLAFALMSINLMELVNLALPIAIILTVQVVVMILYSVFVTFRVCGKSYDAAVLSAGHCGFGLGATPTAMVNMQTITNHYGPSHVAFIVVPLVGAFFVDIINALTIKGFLALPFHY
ncbi:sodium/glutamate symporter [Helicobacter ailurogastricus]|uniref:Sodium/glutamate symporter n=1 Tax=Helicobacter ailurogastricus TaxID=1578720 RepID=A0A0K2Y5W8_9HELI|nr:sodium/glutamate symporter [Helicobacter ailurogastricus]BDQ28850.1 sodium/glutamate symporter [Helicobacter ailurogastricus]CRI32372.1 Sodium/glutamate symport protein [Helicobacter ailurogastricus]